MDCPATIPADRSRCPRCQSKRDRERNSTSYYQSREWRRLRRACIMRDRCCVVTGSTHRMTAHHVIAREAGGPDSLENLATLAGDVHSAYEAAVRDGKDTPLRRRVDQVLNDIATARNLRRGVVI